MIDILRILGLHVKTAVELAIDWHISLASCIHEQLCFLQISGIFTFYRFELYL